MSSSTAAERSRVFVDTSFVVAGLSTNDRNHGAAVSLGPALERRRALTTNHIVGECWTLVRRRHGHDAACRVLDALRTGQRYRIVHADETIEAEAAAWLRRHDERAYSFADAVSFAVMRRHGVTEALAFDGDFEAAGFVTLRPA